jgi:hypothetical protein
MIFAVTDDDLRKLVIKKTRLTDWLQTAGAIRALGKCAEHVKRCGR